MRSRSPVQQECKTLVISCCMSSEQWPALQMVAAAGHCPVLDVTLEVQGPKESRSPGAHEEWTRAVLEAPGSARLVQKAMAQLYPQNCTGTGNLVVLATHSSPEAAASLAEVVVSWQQCFIGPARAVQFDAPLAPKPSEAMAELRQWLGSQEARRAQRSFPAKGSDPPSLGLALSEEAAQSHRRMWRRVRSTVAHCLGIQESRGPRRIRPPPWLNPEYQARMDHEEEESKALRLTRAQSTIYLRPSNHTGADDAFKMCGTSDLAQQRFWRISDYIPWGDYRDMAMTGLVQELVRLLHSGVQPWHLDAWLTTSIRFVIFEYSPFFPSGRDQVLPRLFYDSWSPYSDPPVARHPWLLLGPQETQWSISPGDPLWGRHYSQ